VLCTCSSDPPPTPDAGASTIEVDTSSPGRGVPDDFLGFSVEWGSDAHGVAQYVGDGKGNIRAPLVGLIKSFASEGHCPVLRVGGNSEDLAWWNPNGAPRPPNVDIDIGQTDIATLAAYHATFGCSLVLGMNLALGDANNASDLAKAALVAIPRAAILAFEPGNEPDSRYTEFSSYMMRFDAFRDAVASNVASDLPFEWPALASRFWLTLLDGALAKEKGRVAIVSTHTYPFTVCQGLPPPAPANLLTDAATETIGTVYAPHVVAAHDAGFVYRMGELNSVSCGGGEGASDTYAAALWAADIALVLAGAGVDGLNFHGPGNYYGAYAWDQDVLQVRPLFYGLRLASLATARHGRLLPVSIASRTRVRAFATIGDDGIVRALVLHEDDGIETLRLHFRDGRSGASALRLHAPSLDAKKGITLGGATYDETEDGMLVGAVKEESLVRDGDSWMVTLAGYDAVLVAAR
jgi:hypothetical protein